MLFSFFLRIRPSLLPNFAAEVVTQNQPLHGGLGAGIMFLGTASYNWPSDQFWNSGLIGFSGKEVLD
jgi:hypothetical protein